MTSKLEANGIKCYLLRKYVDDVNVYIEALALGKRYRDGVLTWCLKDEKRDSKSGKSLTLLTMDIFTAMANDIFDSLTFSQDIPEKSICWT